MTGDGAIRPAASAGGLRRTIGADLSATALAAVLSGTPSTLHSLVTRRPVLSTVRAAATLTRPHPDRPSLVADLVAGGLAHAAVSLFWGAVLARVLPRGRRAGWGAVAGAAIHVLDLGIIARVVPRLGPMRRLPQLPQLGDHVAFGFVFGLALDRVDPPSPAVGDRVGQATSSRPAG